jgi:hypothetical protein
MVKVSNYVEKSYIEELRKGNDMAMLAAIENSIVFALVDNGDAADEDDARQYVDSLVAQHIE